MQTRARFHAGRPAALPPGDFPLLEAGDLPGDDDWAIVESVRRDPTGDGDLEMVFHPDFD